jgi:hypothetical protein|tara:strand:+ start:1841 stop:2080 length:240 start_codon:yes stop_codon:yes gene_type:complete
MAHVVISVSPDIKERIDGIRDNIEEANGYRLSYSNVVKMLLKAYEDRLPIKDPNQLELDFSSDGPETPVNAGILDRYKG